MTKITTTEMMKFINHLEDLGMVGFMQVMLAKKNTHDHATLLTTHTEEEGYTHILMIRTLTKEVLCHEMAHAIMHRNGTYNQNHPHDERHEAHTIMAMREMERIG